MVRLLFLFLLLLPSAALAEAVYQLDLQLYPQQQRLMATAVLPLEDLSASSISLRLAERCEPIAVAQAGRELPYRFNNGRLQVELYDQSPLSISYQGRFADPTSQQPGHNEDPSYGVEARISPQGVFLSAAADWYPNLPDAEFRYRIRVVAPAGFEAVTSGQRLERANDADRSVSVWQTDYPLSGITLAAGRYQVFEDQIGAVPIYAYFYRNSSTLAQIYLHQAADYLNLYQQLFGPYPYRKFAIVENFFPTGYGFPSWTLLGSSVIRLPFIVKTSLGHEVAHSWWGTGVRVDYRQGNWAEGLTSYVADYLYKERESASAAKEYRLKVLRDFAELVDAENGFPLAAFQSRNDKASQAIGYGKGAMLFHMLRREVGEETFWATLRQIAEQKRFKQIGWSDFNRYFSQATETDLKPFFRQWLQGKLAPSLSIEKLQVVQDKSGYRVEGILRQADPWYRLKLPLRLETEAGVVEQTLVVGMQQQPFELAAAARPTRLTFDPDQQIFRLLAAEELPATVNSLRASDDLLVLQGERLLPSQAAIDRLLAGLRKTGTSIRHAEREGLTELAQHDLLSFGYSAAVKPAALQDHSFLLAGESYALADSSALIVTQNPWNPAKVAGWFLSNETAPAEVAARKIPHYGKYSYLLFRGGNNLLKGTSAGNGSPLDLDLRGLPPVQSSAAAQM